VLKFKRKFRRQRVNKKARFVANYPPDNTESHITGYGNINVLGHENITSIIRVVNMEWMVNFKGCDATKPRKNPHLNLSTHVYLMWLNWDQRQGTSYEFSCKLIHRYSFKQWLKTRRENTKSFASFRVRK